MFDSFEQIFLLRENQGMEIDDAAWKDLLQTLHNCNRIKTNFVVNDNCMTQMSNMYRIFGRIHTLSKIRVPEISKNKAVEYLQCQYKRKYNKELAKSDANDIYNTCGGLFKGIVCVLNFVLLKYITSISFQILFVCLVILYIDMKFMIHYCEFDINEFTNCKNGDIDDDFVRKGFLEFGPGHHFLNENLIPTAESRRVWNILKAVIDGNYSFASPCACGPLGPISYDCAEGSCEFISIPMKNYVKEYVQRFDQAGLL